MSIDQAQITRCDRCGAEHIHRFPAESDCEQVNPTDWLILSWHQAATVYTFAFCPGCAAAFVEFAAEARGGPKLRLVQS